MSDGKRSSVAGGGGATTGLGAGAGSFGIVIGAADPNADLAGATAVIGGCAANGWGGCAYTEVGHGTQVVVLGPAWGTGFEAGGMGGNTWDVTEKLGDLLELVFGR